MNRTQIEKHFGESWVDFMSPFVETPEFDAILTKLKEEKAAGKVVFPEPALVFRAFRETPLPTVKVIIMGQDPYPKAGYSTGLAFGIPKDINPIPPSLLKIVDAVEVDVYSGMNLEKPAFDVTLESWAKQGVLLLNSALTVCEKEPGTHQELWKPFMKFVMDRVNVVCKDVIVLTWGTAAADICTDVNIFTNYNPPKCEHPSAAAHGKRAWPCKHFSTANAILTASKREKIKW
jgi:uracil-DNA glycosylase